MKQIASRVPGLSEANSGLVVLWLISGPLLRRLMGSIIARLRLRACASDKVAESSAYAIFSFWKSIYAERDFRLEAVTSYRGQCFNPHIVIGDEVCFLMECIFH